MKIVAFTGKGISDGDIPSFRNSVDRLFSDDELTEILSTKGLKEKPTELFNCHNLYRKKLRFAKPNLVHKILKILEDTHIVNIVTQNIDDLHEKAESLNVYHLYGELFKTRLINDDSENPITFDCRNDLVYGESLEDGEELRPHTVLFDEYPYHIEKTKELLTECDVLLIIGASLNDSDTLRLLSNANRLGVRIVYIDPLDEHIQELENIYTLAVFDYIQATASEGLKQLKL